MRIRNRKIKRKTVAKAGIGLGLAGGVAAVLATNPSTVDKVADTTSNVAKLGNTMLETTGNVAKFDADVLSEPVWLMMAPVQW